MSFTTAIIADPLMFTLDQLQLQQYQAKCQAITLQLPLTDMFSHVGNNQLNSFAYRMWCNYNSAQHTPHSPHPAALQNTSGYHQFIPQYKKLGVSKYDRKTSTRTFTPTPNLVYGEGDKDHLVNANALMSAWQRAFHHRKLAPDYVLILDPYNRRNLSPSTTGPKPPTNRINPQILATVARDCTARGVPFSDINY